MISPSVTRWFNAGLIAELEATISRIPKDLNTWTREIKKLNKIKRPTAKHRLIARDYRRLRAYYLGKMLAYSYVLEKLGDGVFVLKHQKKHHIKVDDKGNYKTKWAT